MSSTSAIELHRDGPLARIVLNRPGQRNALGREDWRSLEQACNALSADIQVQLVLIEASGDHFCAGADLTELSTHISDQQWMREATADTALAIDAWASLPQPSIAVIRGCCFGGGIALAAAADFRVCDSSARFALTPARLGLSYRLKDCHRITQIVGMPMAKRLLLAAEELDATQALDCGLVTHKVDPDQLDPSVHDRCAQLMSLSGYSQRVLKATLNKIASGHSTDDEQTRQWFEQAFGGEDFERAARAFVQRVKSKDAQS